jgi:DNA-binding response OmpR family regulator
VNPPTIYIFDRDPDLCSSLSLFLEENGFRTQVFSKKETPMSLLILEMPTHYHEITHLLNQLRTRETPLPIILIACDINSFERDLQELAGVTILYKPISPDQLLAAIQKYI